MQTPCLRPVTFVVPDSTKKIAVTGATRRVGGHLVELLESSGNEVVPISRSHGVDVIAGEGLEEAAIGRARCLPLAAERFGRRVAVRIGRRTLAAAGELGSNDHDRAAIDREPASSLPTEGRIAPTEVSCPRRMMVILQLCTAARTQLPRRRVRPCDRHAPRAIAMTGAVTASSCQLSPRSGLRSSRPSAMPQTSSSARAASVYGIDSPGTGSSRQASPSQR